MNTLNKFLIVAVSCAEECGGTLTSCGAFDTEQEAEQFLRDILPPPACGHREIIEI